MTDAKQLTGIHKFKNHSAFKLQTKAPALARARPTLLLREGSPKTPEQRESPEFGAKHLHLSGNLNAQGTSVGNTHQAAPDLVSSDPSFSLCDKRTPSKSFKLAKRDRMRENSSDSEQSSQASTGQGNLTNSGFRFLDRGLVDRMTKQRSQIYAQAPIRTPEDHFGTCKSQISIELSKPSTNNRTSMRPSALSVDIFARTDKSDISFARIDPDIPEEASEKEKSINSFLDKMGVFEHDFKRVLEETNRIHSTELEDIRRKQSSQSAIGFNPKLSSASLSVLRQKRLIRLQQRGDSFVTSNNTPNEFTLDDTPKTRPLASLNSKDDDFSQNGFHGATPEDFTIPECPGEAESPKKLGELMKKKLNLEDDDGSSESYSDISDSVESESQGGRRRLQVHANIVGMDTFFHPNSPCEPGSGLEELESAKLKKSGLRLRASRNQSQKQQITAMDSSPELGVASEPTGALTGDSSLSKGLPLQQQNDYSLLLATMGEAESTFKSETLASRDLFAGSGVKTSMGEQQSPFFNSTWLQKP